MSKYRQEFLLGAGGMGEVYRATRILEFGDERPVACKMMKPGLMSKPDGVRRFHREASLTIDLDHEHVVRMIDYVVDDAGVQFLITELVDGVSVAEILDGSLTRAQLSADMVRVIAADVLDALAYVHGRGVLHRDISPSNMLVCRNGAIKVSDFGMARALSSDARHSGSYLGKLAYQAPEVRKGAAVDARSDLFSFAASVYELLTGAPPFGKSLPDAALRRLDCEVAPLPDDVPDDLRQLVMGLLVKDPDERRPQTASEARGLLRMPADQRAVTAELGAASASLYEEKCARGEVRLCARFKSPSARMLPVRQVVEVLAETWPGREDAAADVDGEATRSTGGSDRGGREGEANGQRATGRRSRLVTMLAAMATVVLIVLWGTGERSSDKGESRAVPPDSPESAEKGAQDAGPVEASAARKAPMCMPSEPGIDGTGHLNRPEPAPVPVKDADQPGAPPSQLPERTPRPVPPAMSPQKPRPGSVSVLMDMAAASTPERGRVWFSRHQRAHTYAVK